MQWGSKLGSRVPWQQKAQPTLSRRKRKHPEQAATNTTLKTLGFSSPSETEPGLHYASRPSGIRPSRINSFPWERMPRNDV